MNQHHSGTTKTEDNKLHKRRIYCKAGILELDYINVWLKHNSVKKKQKHLLWRYINGPVKKNSLSLFIDYIVKRTSDVRLFMSLFNIRSQFVIICGSFYVRKYPGSTVCGV